jgi:hypothetical protein
VKILTKIMPWVELEDETAGARRMFCWDAYELFISHAHFEWG